MPHTAPLIATIVVGLYAVHRILAVGERARGDRRAVMAALAEEVRGLMPPPLRGLSTVPGVRDVVALPISLVSWLLPERRRSRRSARGHADRPPGST